MISNYISYAISLIEILFIGGAVWGWGFMQYMFEKEYVFYDSQCLHPCLDDCIDHPDNTSEYISGQEFLKDLRGVSSQGCKTGSILHCVNGEIATPRGPSAIIRDFLQFHNWDILENQIVFCCDCDLQYKFCTQENEFCELRSCILL